MQPEEGVEKSGRNCVICIPLFKPKLEVVRLSDRRATCRYALRKYTRYVSTVVRNGGTLI
jgi:hypothetical protein